MKDIKKIMFSPLTMVILLVILSIALATATFIENDFGAEVARLKIYNTRWLELIFILLSINLIGRVILLKLYKARKFSIFLFHIALVVMIIGAGVTRYFGYEGTMHIREGNFSSTLVMAQKVISVNVDKSLDYEFDADIEHTQAFNEVIKENLFSYDITLTKIYENAYPKAVPAEDGSPVINFMIVNSTYRGSDYLADGEVKDYGEINLSFNSNEKATISLFTENDSIYMLSKSPVFVSSMAGEQGMMNVNEKVLVKPQTLYKINNTSFVLQGYLPKAKIVPMPTQIEGHAHATTALVFEINDGENTTQLTLWGNSPEKYTWAKLDEHTIGMMYGNKIINLPFSIHLNDFVIDRYPGSMSPSSFSSYVTLNEEGKEPIPFHIYMNNILKYQGFRFYQSSYDQDEKGTILSVNNDKWGTMITYFGYILLAIGMLWSMLNSNSFFRKTVIRNAKTTVTAILIVLGGAFTISTQAQNPHSPHAQAQIPIDPVHPKVQQKLPDNFVEIDEKQADEFGKMFIQNNAGRTEPVYTYASELLRKISRKEELYGMSPVQLFLEMNMDPELWINMPLIRITNKELQEKLGITGKYAAYTDFISQQSGYLLQGLIQASFAKSPAKRSKFDKAVIKTDEKVNICYSIFSGRYMKILPVPGDADSTHWHAPMEASLKAKTKEDSIFLANILPTYFNEINHARETGDYTQATELLNGIKAFQKKNAGYELPSAFKTNLEVTYYKQNPFKKLFPFYATVGVIFLFILIGIIVAGKTIPKWVNRTFFVVVLIGFIFHTLGIAARWIISGHAPMSNGYESMTFISWVTLLAGFLFSKRSPFAIPATAALGGLTLMVANLSFMDPQITNLVPVLQSYWLTIHVSVITASYGFLALGALLGMINLILILLRSKKNHKHIVETLESLTIINHKTLIAGLYLLTIGTFLGAVWANESWGRYWGWDPKETWALISIIVYSIVTHARLIPGLKGLFIFNTLALFAFSSILMTYFGVNYYLSGLHSYAAGDPVPVPTFVYYTVASVVILALAASIKYRKLLSQDKSFIP